MAILYKLFSIFFKIGAICFGGGYAMISLIEKEVVGNGWLNAYEFLNIIGIAEMTPGPIAINSATFVGYKIAGVKGSLFATIGVILPSFITATLLSKFLFKKENKRILEPIFYFLKPVILGLIAAAAIQFISASLFSGHGGIELSAIDFKSLGIIIFALVASLKYKAHPILVIVSSASISLISYYALGV